MMEEFNARKYFSSDDIRKLKHLRDWPGARNAFEDLDDQEKQVLRYLARGRTPPAHEDAIENLEENDWIEKKKKEWQLVSDPLAEFIRYKCTPEGELILRIERPFRSLHLSPSFASVLTPHSITFLGFLLFVIPPSLFFILLQYSPAQDWVVQTVTPLENIINGWQNYFVIPTLLLGGIFAWMNLQSEHKKRWLILPLISFFTFLSWLGVSVVLNIMLAIFALCDLGALWLLYEAFVKSKRAPKKFGGINEFLSQVMDMQIWKDVRKWPRGKVIVFIFLFISGFLFFLYALTPQELDLEIPSSLDIEAQAFFPAWLSERDKGDLIILLRNQNEPDDVPVNGTLILEPELGHLLKISPAEDNSHKTGCQFSLEPNDQALLHWRIKTMPQSAFHSDTYWRIRYVFREDTADCSVRNIHPEEFENLSIPKLRVGFGLWGMLEYQPLVSVLSIVSGLVYALAEIWISSHLMSFPHTTQKLTA